MRYSDGNAYIIQSGGRKRRRRSGGAGRAAGVLISVLLLLTAAICLLVVFLPRLEKSKTVGAASASVSGMTYYFLCTEETDGRVQSIASAQNAMERGGAGYVYNDGKYKTVAAVYERESDVKTLVTVNAESFYFSLGLPSGEYDSGDRAVIDYLTGEWFETLSTAATELDRGNISESAAEYAAASACKALRDLAYGAHSEKLKNAITSFDYSPPQSQTVLSYIRYIQVRYVLNVISALT